MIAEKKARNATRGLDNLKAAEDVAFGIGKRLALLENDGSCELVVMLPNQRLKSVQ